MKVTVQLELEINPIKGISNELMLQFFLYTIMGYAHEVFDPAMEEEKVGEVTITTVPSYRIDEE